MAEGQNESPLDYCLRIMRDPTVDAKRRDQMALKALPFIHKAKAAPSDGEEPKRVVVRKFTQGVTQQ